VQVFGWRSLSDAMPFAQWREAPSSLPRDREDSRGDASARLPHSPTSFFSPFWTSRKRFVLILSVKGLMKALRINIFALDIHRRRKGEILVPVKAADGVP
jgi:hypothetical protein